jgi:vacuolar-type H+-ATPase subunit I/STV1
MNWANANRYYQWISYGTGTVIGTAGAVASTVALGFGTTKHELASNPFLFDDRQLMLCVLVGSVALAVGSICRLVDKRRQDIGGKQSALPNVGATLRVVGTVFLIVVGVAAMLAAFGSGIGQQEYEGPSSASSKKLFSLLYAGTAGLALLTSGKELRSMAKWMPCSKA